MSAEVGRMTLLGYASIAWSGTVSVWVDRSDPRRPTIYIADMPVGYHGGGLPLGLRPAPRTVAIAAGCGHGVSTATLRQLREHVEWRDA